MNKKLNKILAAIIIIGFTFGIIWIAIYPKMYYPTMYYYYLWRLNKTTEWAEIIDLCEKIEVIAPHIMPLLVKTYEDVNSPERSRGAAAGGLAKVDREKAEALFMNDLKSKNINVVRMAVIHLGSISSHKPFEEILRLSGSPNEDIRMAVVDYLGSINKKDSISRLKYMMKNDESKIIRDYAEYKLQRLGVRWH